MTRGRGGVWPNDDVITEIQFFGKFLGFSPVILLKFSPKFSNSQVNLKLNLIVSDLLQDIVLIDKPPTLSC